MALWEDISNNVMVEDEVLVFDPDYTYVYSGTLAICKVVGFNRDDHLLNLAGNRLSRFSTIHGVSCQNIIFNSEELEEVARIQLVEAIEEAHRRNEACEKWANSLLHLKEPEYPAVDAFGCWYDHSRPGYPCVQTFAFLTLDSNGDLLDEKGKPVDVNKQGFAVTYIDEDLDQHIDNIIIAASPFLCY